MKVFLDTNIIFDLVLNRPPFSPSAKRLFAFSEQGAFAIYVSSLSIANTEYVLSKKIGKEPSRKVLLDLCRLVEIVDLDEGILFNGLKKPFPDAEDAWQYYSARKVSCTHIVSRDKKGFVPFTDIAVVTPKHFLDDFSV